MNENWLITEISYDDILPIWREHLWPNRTSPYETHSAMTWPYTSDIIYDMDIFNYPAIYWGFYDNDQLCGVNSGHATSDTEYRSRGLWVDPLWRSEGVGTTLLTKTLDHAKDLGYSMIWSLPRVSSVGAYYRAGFVDIGSQVKTETSDANIYVRRYF